MNKLQSGRQGSSTESNVKEYVVRVAGNDKRQYNVMKFDGFLNVDFTKWSGAKMEREDNAKQFTRPEEEAPQFGAGSEYGKLLKEEARRKKLGINTKKYRAEDQPWLLRVGGRGGIKYKGIREGGVSDNTSYYVFTQASDGAFEASPVNEWYNFKPINRYKSLTSEEAEEQFEKRGRILNYFSVMVQKRLKNDDEEVGGTGEAGGVKEKGKKKSKKAEDAMKISEMDDWMESDEEDNSEKESDDDGEDNDKKKKTKEKTKKKQKENSDEESEPEEESDDGDDEGREVDYITDSSSSDDELDIKGVAEETALRKLLSSDDEQEEEDKDKDKDDKKENGTDEVKKEDQEKSRKKKKKKKEKHKKIKERVKTEKSSSDSSPASSDNEVEREFNQMKQSGNSSSTNSSRANTPTAEINSNKRKGEDTSDSSSKKFKADPVNYSPVQGEAGISEDAVRRYLMRKPMTTVELCQKFKAKKTGLSSDQLVQAIALILKRINPVKQTIKGKMYLSLKSV